ncbi:MAG: M56 family metallopeptidase [Roseburia sp.]|nr:M56 family metallopeptidase [Roseburia sp.]
MSLWEMSLSGAVLIPVIVLLRALLINKLPKRTFVILWGIALARLLLPIAVPSALSAYNVPINAPAWERDMDISAAVSIPIAQAFASVRLGEAADFAGTEPFSMKNYDTGVTFLTREDMSEAGTESHEVDIPAAGGGTGIWTLLWGVGVAFCGMYFAVAYVRCRLKFRESLPVFDSFVDEWLRARRLRRKIEVRQSDRVTTPLTYGIFSPVILLPKETEWENKQALSCILLHEYVHICRWDAARKLIATAALCIHWFNPTVWALYILFNRDIELACDECVVHQCGEDMRSFYARMLVCMEERRSGLMPLCNNFSRTAIEGRIKAIMKTKKTSIGALIMAGVLIMGVTAVFATSAKGKEETPAAIAGTEFSEEELEKLLALQLAGYEDMTIAEYQEKVWAATDFAEYMELLERFSRDKVLYEMRDTDETAAFFFYIVEPLTAPRRRTWDYSGSVQYEAPWGDSALLEYTLTLRIRRPEALTVREYADARSGFADGIENFWQSLSAETFLQEDALWDAARAGMDALTRQWESEALELSVDYAVLPLENPARTDMAAWDEEERALWQQALAEREAQWEELLAPYLPFGLTYRYDAETDNYRLYYGGREVRGLCDEHEGLWISEHAGISTYEEGAFELYAVYDEAGRLTGLRAATAEEERAWTDIRSANTAALREMEERRNAYATEEDYRSLLALRTANHQQLSVAEFNDMLLAWANENYERMERISEDTGTQGYQASLSDEERAFLELTVRLSGEENGKRVQSSYTGKAEDDPVFAEQLPEKLITDENRTPAWCDLYYRFSWHITDKNIVTVGERDACVGGMIDAVRGFWEETDVEELLAMTEADVTARLRAIAVEYSNGHVAIAVDEDGVGYECMDERGLQW